MFTLGVFSQIAALIALIALVGLLHPSFPAAARASLIAAVLLAVCGAVIGSTVPLTGITLLLLPAFITFAVTMLLGIGVHIAADPRCRRTAELFTFSAACILALVGFVGAVWQGGWERVSLTLTPAGLWITIISALAALFLIGLMARSRPERPAAFAQPVPDRNDHSVR
ncbi:MAG: hypothetical protein AB7S36_07295 [Planctomycetota bacterium]